MVHARFRFVYRVPTLLAAVPCCTLSVSLEQRQAASSRQGLELLSATSSEPFSSPASFSATASAPAVAGSAAAVEHTAVSGPAAPAVAVPLEADQAQLQHVWTFIKSQLDSSHEFLKKSEFDQEKQAVDTLLSEKFLTKDAAQQELDKGLQGVENAGAKARAEMQSQMAAKKQELAGSIETLKTEAQTALTGFEQKAAGDLVAAEAALKKQVAEGVGKAKAQGEKVEKKQAELEKLEAEIQTSGEKAQREMEATHEKEMAALETEEQEVAATLDKAEILSGKLGKEHGEAEKLGGALLAKADQVRTDFVKLQGDMRVFSQEANNANKAAAVAEQTATQNLDVLKDAKTVALHADGIASHNQAEIAKLSGELLRVEHAVVGK